MNLRGPPGDVVGEQHGAGLHVLRLHVAFHAVLHWGTNWRREERRKRKGGRVSVSAREESKYNEGGMVGVTKYNKN